MYFFISQPFNFFKDRIVKQIAINNYLSKFNIIDQKKTRFPMRKYVYAAIILCTINISMCYGQTSPVEKGVRAITPDVIKAQLGFLASDWTEGRFAGEKGEFLAADYITSMLRLYGVKPGGDNISTRSRDNNNRENERSYFQNFVMLKTIAGDEQILKVRSTDGKMEQTTNFIYNVDFTVRPSDPGIEIDAPVVFAGFGLINKSLKYNDFIKLDVKGKFVLRITGLPEFMRKSLDMATYTSMVRETESYLKAMGAAGILDFSPAATVVGNPENREFMDLSPSEGIPRPGSRNTRYSIPGKSSPDELIRISVSVKTASEILKGTGINIDDYIKKADINEPFMIPPMSNKSVYLKTTVKTSQVAVRNIIGVIEGNNPDKIIVLGAHYDHMGISNGYIWNGADDNGSGVVGVMTLAKALIESGVKPEKTIIIALWTAEEEGMLGSRYYIQNLSYPINYLKLNMNFDMISRYFSDEETRKVTMTYTNSIPRIKEITSDNLNKYGIDLLVDYQPSANPVGASDEATFINAGIPIIRIKTVHRNEYHTPDDELNTIDWDIMEKIIKIGFTIIWDLANTDW